MRVAVESWAPEFGAPADLESVREVPTDLDVEVPVDQWKPVPQPAGPIGGLVFVDGVRRVEARLWIEPDAGVPMAGICASYAAGAIRCNGKAEIEGEEVRRGLFCREGGPTAIRTRHGAFERHVVAADETENLVQALQQRMSVLEADVSAAVDRQDGELLVVDGPLNQRREGLLLAVGYVKTHQTQYLTPPATDVVPLLAPGQRTPVFRIGGGKFERWSWYLRLPGRRDHGWSGVVRCEATGDLPLAEAVALAERTAAALPRYASEGHKDPRAPQNLYPIGGLEKRLKHLLGDPQLWYRALRTSPEVA